MKLFENEKQRQFAIGAFAVLAGVVLFTLMMINIGTISSSVRKFLGLFKPFYIGLAVAYLLNPLMRLFENKVFNKISKPTMRRTLAQCVTYLLFLLVLVGFLAYVAPALLASVTNFVTNISANFKNYTQYMTDYVNRHPMINEIYENHSEAINSYIQDGVNFLSSYFSELLLKIMGMTAQITVTFINIFVGFIISIYLLYSKEKLIAQLKKVLAFLLSDSKNRKLLRVAHVTHTKTIRFFAGRILGSIIIAVLSFVCMKIFKFPYPLLNAIIIGVFNMIPYFGSYLSAIPTSLIVLVTKPSSFVFFVIFIIVLEQIDGNLIGPHIQGKQLGLSALWVIFAIFLFGGMFGFLGLLVGVPIFAVIYYFVSEWINQGLARKGKSQNTTDYAVENDKEML